MIHGGGGRDDVYGEDGSDRAFGDSQGDFIDVSGDLVHDLADGGSGDDYCQIDPGVDATRSCEAP